MFFVSRKTPRQKYLAEIAKKYGHGSVPFSRVYPHFEDITRVMDRGFESIGTGLYAKSINDNIVHLMKVYFTKGGGCDIRWGVSLSFVPHKWEKKLQWHRTLKSSRFDLTELSSLYFHTGDWRKDEELSASVLYGETFFRKSLQVLWQRVQHGIEDWFNATTDVNGVLARATEHTTRTKIMLPYPELICAFCLARLGLMQESDIALQKFLGKSKETPESIQHLEQAINKIQKEKGDGEIKYSPHPHL